MSDRTGFILLGILAVSCLLGLYIAEQDWDEYRRDHECTRTEQTREGTPLCTTVGDITTCMPQTRHLWTCNYGPPEVWR